MTYEERPRLRGLQQRLRIDGEGGTTASRAVDRAVSCIIQVTYVTSHRAHAIPPSHCGDLSKWRAALGCAIHSEGQDDQGGQLREAPKRWLP
jgi:hypothetical protein